ncbi:MAG: EF-hand domain-containing protein [Campylobacterota bacterium]|nr:EF-hand domain-containing protein [Campylobacterota bacterium]
MRNLTKSLILVSLISGVAFAVPTAQQKFSSADKNNDGILTSEEFYNDQAVKMEKKMKEGKALKGVSTAPHFDGVDKNSDGKVTFKEYDTFHTIRQREMVSIKNQGRADNQGYQMFQKYDKNSDGNINREEFRNLYQNMQQNIVQRETRGYGQGMKGKNAGQLMGQGMQGRGYSSNGNPTPFSTFDKNRDGFITENEFYVTQGENMSTRSQEGRAMRKAPYAPKFSDMDINGDGKITQSELIQGQNERMQQNRLNRGNK